MDEGCQQSGRTMRGRATGRPVGASYHSLLAESRALLGVSERGTGVGGLEVLVVGLVVRLGARTFVDEFSARAGSNDRGRRETQR